MIFGPLAAFELLAISDYVAGQKIPLLELAAAEDMTQRRPNPKLILAPVVSGNWWLEFPGFQDPKNPFHDKRMREAVSLAIDRYG